MCLGTIALVVAVRDDRGVRVARLDDGCEVPLSFVPQAQAGDRLLLHLGVPVEVIDPESARTALSLRQSAHTHGGEIS